MNQIKKINYRPWIPLIGFFEMVKLETMTALVINIIYHVTILGCGIQFISNSI